MAILNRPKLGLRRRNLLLAAAALVFIVSCVAAAPFALRIGLNSKDAAETPSEAVVTPQDVVVAERQGVTQEAREKEMNEVEMNWKNWKKKIGELGALRRALHEKMGATLTQEEEAKLKEELWHLEQQSLELERAKPESHSIEGSELAKMVQISMSQAIQIANAQQPGTVKYCNLVADRTEGREVVQYDVWIFSAEGAESTITRVNVNAIDGRIMSSQKQNR